MILGSFGENDMLKKVECFLRPSKLEEVKDGLVGMGVEGMSVSEVKGFGAQRGYQKTLCGRDHRSRQNIGNRSGRCCEDKDNRSRKERHLLRRVE